MLTSSTSVGESVLGDERLQTGGSHGRLLRGAVVGTRGVRPWKSSPLDPNAICLIEAGLQTVAEVIYVIIREGLTS